MAVFVFSPVVAFFSRRPLRLLLIPIFIYFFHIYISHAEIHSSTGRYPKKHIVAARKAADNTAWVTEHLRDWQAKVYVVDDQSAELTVPKNKGHESMAYLTYIIHNYDRLPDFMAFIHGPRYQWHNDDPLYDSLSILKSLRLPHVFQAGFVPLRCNWIPGCPVELRPLSPTQEPPVSRVHAEAAYADVFRTLFPGEPVPSAVGAPCAAQFAVSKKQVRRRDKESYERIRKWLIETELPDETSGRVMEYMWHIIMGMPPRYCPPAKECYCKAFGACELKCPSAARCEKRYVLPKYADIPEGWPERGGGENGWPIPRWNE